MEWLSWRRCVLVTREPVSSGQLILFQIISCQISLCSQHWKALVWNENQFRISISVFFHSVILVEIFGHWTNEGNFLNIVVRVEKIMSGAGWGQTIFIQQTTRQFHKF